jgi:flavin-dependent dehydrogenase
MIYDTIICGAGLSGRLLAYYLVKANSNKKILIIDKKKIQRDVLLGFWEEGVGEFDTLLQKQSKKLITIDRKSSKEHILKKYIYKYLYKNDLFDYIDKFIEKNATHISDTICAIDNHNPVVVECSKASYLGRQVYSSVWLKEKQNQKNIVNNIQNFFGYEIFTKAKFESPVFMDFSHGTDNEFKFGYVLPLDDNRALIHIVNYSKYTSSNELEEYIKQFTNGAEYKVLRKESGSTIIGLPRKHFARRERLVEIGIQGGQINQATGFGFSNFILDAKLLADEQNKGSRINQSLSFGFLFFCMSLLINIKPSWARLLFYRINRIDDYDLVLDFVDSKGGFKTISSMLRAIIFSN